MQRVLLVVAVAALLIDVYAIVSCALMPADRVRTGPKWLWLLAVVLVPVIGSIAWIAVGRERATRTAPGRTVAPDDDPARFGGAASSFSRTEQDRRIAQLEAELAELDAEGDPDGDPGRRPRA